MNIAVDPPIPPGRMAATITLGQYGPLDGELPVDAGLPVGGGLCHVFSRVHADLCCRFSRVGSYLLQQPDVQWHSESPTERNAFIILPQGHPIIDPQATHYVLEPMKLYDGGRSIHYTSEQTASRYQAAWDSICSLFCIMDTFDWPRQHPVTT